MEIFPLIFPGKSDKIALYCKCDDDTKQSSRNLQRAAGWCKAVVGLCVSYLSRVAEAHSRLPRVMPLTVKKVVYSDNTGGTVVDANQSPREGSAPLRGFFIFRR